MSGSMRIRIGAALLCWGAGPGIAQEVNGPGASNLQLKFHAGAGISEYEEHPSIAPVESEWSAFSGFASMNAELKLGSPWILGGAVSGLATVEDLEKWTENGLPVQKNDLRVQLLDFRLDAGRNLALAEGMELSPRMGIGHRLQGFQRRNFVIDGKTSDLGEVDEIYNLVYLHLGSGWKQYWTRETGLVASLRGGWFVYTQADNDLVGEVIEGNGGFLVEGSLSWFWEVGEASCLSIGLLADVQRLEGEATTVIENPGRQDARFYDVEWPDNDWSVVGARLSWEVRL